MRPARTRRSRGARSRTRRVRRAGRGAARSLRERVASSSRSAPQYMLGDMTSTSKRSASLLVAFLLWSTGRPADRAVEGAPPGYVATKLPNGLEVSILPDPAAPIVATQVWYHVGSANEDKGSRGLAHLFEHLMFGATKTHGKEDYERLHHRFGGDENAYTSPDETVYVSEIPPEGHAEVLALEADRMRGLVLSEENLANEQKIVTEELRLRTENDPMSRLFVEAQKQLLGDHPYAFSAVGEKKDVAAATVASCRSFYDRYYHPDLAHLVIVGPVDADATLREVERAFGPLAPGATRPAEVP